MPARRTTRATPAAASWWGVNALSTFTVRWLLPRLADFRNSHPEIDVAVTTSNDAVDMAGESADIIIRGGPDAIHGYVTRIFLAETRQPVCNSVLLGRLPLGEPGDLRADTLLHSSNMARLWDEWLTVRTRPGSRGQSRARSFLSKQTFLGYPPNVCLDSFVFAEFFPKTGKAPFGNSA